MTENLAIIWPSSPSFSAERKEDWRHARSVWSAAYGTLQTWDQDLQAGLGHGRDGQATELMSTPRRLKSGGGGSEELVDHALASPAQQYLLHASHPTSLR